MTANGLFPDGTVLGAGKASDRETELAIRALLDAKAADEKKNRVSKKKSKKDLDDDDYEADL